MLVVLLVSTACTAAPPAPEAARTQAASSSSGAPAGATLSPRATPHPVSLPALIEQRFDGGTLRLGRVLGRNSAYTRRSITYESGGLTISGIMNVPSGDRRFPLLILNHGYIDPDVYMTGQGLRREQDYLARRGFVVLHTDYRNHAQSDDDPRADLELRMGYAEDAVNAALAVREAGLPFVDDDRIGMVGRSMGGAVSMKAAIARPDLFDAVVLFASVSSNAADNYNRWIRRDRSRSGIARRIERAWGAPEDNPAFWAAASPQNFFDRLTMPVILHHGTNDDTCPIVWSQRTVTAMRRAGVDARLHTYEGEGHAFGPQWPASMRRTVSFLRRHLA